MLFIGRITAPGIEVSNRKNRWRFLEVYKMLKFRGIRKDCIRLSENPFFINHNHKNELHDGGISMIIIRVVLASRCIMVCVDSFRRKFGVALFHQSLSGTIPRVLMEEFLWRNEIISLQSQTTSYQYLKVERRN